jgi:hypothetical protein
MQADCEIQTSQREAKPITGMYCLIQCLSLTNLGIQAAKIYRGRIRILSQYHVRMSQWGEIHVALCIATFIVGH